MIQSSFLRLPTAFVLLWHGKVAEALLPNLGGAHSLGRVGSFQTCSQSRAIAVQHPQGRAASDLHMSDRPPGNRVSRAVKRLFRRAPKQEQGWPKMPSLWESSSELNRVFDNNKQWVNKCLSEDPQFFSKMTGGQSPNFLFIGCADSRVPAQDITGLKAGEMFVHRNVANLVVHTDLNLMAVLTYAVEVLEVKDIIVCGHYKCGGCAASMANTDHGVLENWLRGIRDVYAKHFSELDAIKDPEQKQRRLIELNVIESCMKLYTNPVVQRKQASTKSFPRIHGLVYDIADGRLTKLPVDFKSKTHANEVYRDVYRVVELDSLT